MYFYDGHWYLSEMDFRHRRRSFAPGTLWDRTTECRNRYLERQLLEERRKRKLGDVRRALALSMPRVRGRFVKRSDDGEAE